MDNKKKAKAKAKANANRVAAYALSGVMLASMIPYNVFANTSETQKAISMAATGEQNLELSHENTPIPVGNPAQDNLPENRNPKTNWDEKADKGDERNWPVDIAGGQRLVRVRTTEPTQITDLNYDGTYTNAEGRDVIKLIYKEKTQAASGVWYRMVLKFDSALFNQIDWDASYGEKRDATKFKFNDAKGKMRNGLTLA